jgi:tetratricopeptide (TPR) repeat protein
VTPLPTDRKRTLLGAFALVAIVLACYLPSLQGGFIWDDDANVSENPTIRNLRGLEYIWTKPHANQQYYPLTHTSFWVEYQLWELWPTGFRITNLLLHAAVATLLWGGLRRLCVPGAWVAAAVFALHPVHVETAAWITERKNLLSAVFYLAALLAYLRFVDGRRRRSYALALTLFAAALLSKTAVLTLPATLLVLVWWKKGRLRRADVLPTLPMFALGGAFGAVTWWLERGHVGAAGPEWDLGILERIIVGGRALWFYAVQLAFPFQLNFIYPRWSIDTGAVWQFAFPVAALALVALLWRWRKRFGRGPLAGVLYFALTLAPALGLLDFYFQLYAFVQDHFQYLASMGLIALLVAAAATALERLHARAGTVAAAVVLLVLGGLTWQRSAYFTSEEALWTSVLERNPRAWMADINLGLVYHDQDRLDEAAALFRHALESDNPDHDKAHYNLALVLEQQNRFGEAEEQYRQALTLNAEYADAHNNLGNLLTVSGQKRQAIAHYRFAIDAEPFHVTARYNLALRLAEEGQDFEAEKHLQQALRLNPGYLDAADLLARIVARQGRHVEAIELYHRVLLLDGSRPEVHYNYALSLEQLDRLDGAEQHYRAAISLDPNLPEPHNNLAIVLYNTRRYPEAWQEVLSYESLGGTPHPGFVAALSEAYPPPDRNE